MRFVSQRLQFVAVAIAIGFWGLPRVDYPASRGAALVSTVVIFFSCGCAAACSLYLCIEHPVWVERVLTVVSEGSGIFYPLVRRGTYVAEGMLLGYLTDYAGNRTLEFQAPAAGIVLFVRAIPSMTKGETIANIGVPAPAR